MTRVKLEKWGAASSAWGCQLPDYTDNLPSAGTGVGVSNADFIFSPQNQ